MKVRSGFVSNSSSSSFCIIGFVADVSDFEEHVKSRGKEGYDKEGDYIDLYNFSEATGLECLCDEGGYVYVGLSIREMKDDETMADFKKRGDALCKKYVGDDIPTSLIVDCIENG